MIARYEVVGAIDRSAAEQIEGAVSVIGDGTSSTSSIGDQCREILTNNWPGPVVVLVKTDPPSTADPSRAPARSWHENLRRRRDRPD